MRHMQCTWNFSGAGLSLASLGRLTPILTLYWLNSIEQHLADDTYNEGVSTACTKNSDDVREKNVCFFMLCNNYMTIKYRYRSKPFPLTIFTPRSLFFLLGPNVLTHRYPWIIATSDVKLSHHYRNFSRAEKRYTIRATWRFSCCVCSAFQHSQ